MAIRNAMHTNPLHVYSKNITYGRGNSSSGWMQALQDATHTTFSVNHNRKTNIMYFIIDEKQVLDILTN